MYSSRRLIFLFLSLSLISFPVFGKADVSDGARPVIGIKLAPSPPLLNQKISGGPKPPVGQETASSPDTADINLDFVLHKSPSGALFRSLLIPGWGQLYTGQWFKALAFLGIDVGMIYGITVQHDRYLDFKEKAANTKIDKYKDSYTKSSNFYKDDRNRLIWWTVGLTLISGFDAYVEAFLYDFKIDPELNATPAGDGIQLGITITIPKR